MIHTLKWYNCVCVFTEVMVAVWNKLNTKMDLKRISINFIIARVWNLLPPRESKFDLQIVDKIL